MEKKKESIQNEVVAESSTNSSEDEIRLQKVKKLQERGIDAWPANVRISTSCADARRAYQEGDETVYTLAGRLVSFRLHGKTAFGHIQDRTGKMQLYFRYDNLGNEKFDFLTNFIDLGDILLAKGSLFKTKTGEITLKVSDFQILSKCLHPLPEKFHGISDVELKYRQRYLDLMSSEEARNRFKIRSQVVSFIRQFLEQRDFMEVETPMLHPIPGGAVAKPFVTHHNALDMDFYLRIAPELYLKRLVIGGFERVYEVNRCFRNEGISTKHNPEFTTIELYWGYQDYHAMMDLMEDLIRSLAKKIEPTMLIKFGDNTLDYGKPFVRMSMKDAVIAYGKISPEMLEEKNIDTLVAQHHIELPHAKASWGEKLVSLFEELVESKLIQPTFITEFPIEVSPLAKPDKQNPAFVSRFELYAGGFELANGYNELNDPFIQAQRFSEQGEARKAGDEEAHYYDQDYITALEYSLPPTVGAGMGIDRLVMLFTNTTSIKEVILFPTLKKKE